MGKSKLFMTAASVTTTMALAACGNLSDSESDPGDGGSEVVIGLVIDRTGLAKFADGNLLAGAEAAADRINEDGGIDGKDVRLVVRDHAADPAKAVQGMRRVEEDDPAVVLMGFLSAVTAAVAPVATSDEVPVIAGSVLPADDSDFVFSTLVPVQYETGTRVEWLAEQGIAKVAVLHDPTPFNLAQIDVLEGQLKEAGIEFTTSVEHAPDAVDLRAQITNIVDAEPEAIIKMSAGPTTVVAAKALAAAGSRLPMVFGFESRENIVGAAAEYDHLFQVVSGIEVSDQLDSADVSEAATDFLEAAADTGGLDQPAYAGRGWDAVYLVKEALEASDGASGAELRDALVDLEPYAGTSATYDFTADDHNGVATNPNYLVQVGPDSERTLVFEPAR